MTINHIVFDIGRVLLAWDPELPFRRLIPDETERRFFMENVCNPAWTHEQDRGRTWADAEAHLVATWPAHEELIRAFRVNWNEMTPHLLPETPAIMERLIDAGHDVTLLTNFADDTFAVALERFPVLARPRGVTVSGRVRLVKPDPEIYAHHAETFGLDPAATIFFDDIEANVATARAAGWHAYVFTGPDAMREDFARHGIAA